MSLICLLCYGIASPTCECGNCAALTDIDGTINIYVNDIRTTRLASVHYLHGEEAHREYAQAFDTMTYIDYSHIRSTHLNFQPYTPKNDYVRTTIDTFDRKLMEYLDKYEHSRASEGRMGSTKQPIRK